MEHTDKLNAINYIRPNAGFIMRGDDIEWLDTEQAQPNEFEIEAGLIAYKEYIVQKAQLEAEAKASAQAKLAALGLTAEEIAALGK